MEEKDIGHICKRAVHDIHPFRQSPCCFSMGLTPKRDRPRQRVNRQRNKRYAREHDCIEPEFLNQANHSKSLFIRPLTPILTRTHFPPALIVHHHTLLLLPFPISSSLEFLRSTVRRCIHHHAALFRWWRWIHLMPCWIGVLVIVVVAGIVVGFPVLRSGCSACDAAAASDGC